MNKIEMQSVYTQSNRDRISAFNSSSVQISKISKSRSDRKILPHNVSLSPEDLQKKIVQEIKQTENILSDICKLLPTPHFEGKPSVNQFRAMEESIRRKERIIKELQEEVQILTNGNFKQSFTKKYATQSPQKSDSQSQIILEMRKKKKTLLQAEKNYVAKLDKATKKRSLLKSLQAEFMKKCQQQGVEFLSFQQFKENEMNKRKEEKKNESDKKISLSSRKQISSVKEIVSGKSIASPRGPKGQAKKYTDLRDRKKVVQSALNSLRVRHEIEMKDLNGKLQFLKDEFDDLSQRLDIKQEQLKEAKKKFGDGRTPSKNPLSLRRIRTERNLRYPRDY